MHAWVVDRPGPMASRPLRWVERPEPVPAPARWSSRAGLRRVPHRPAPGRGRPAAASATASCPATRSSASSTALGAGCDAVRRRRPDRHRLAAAAPAAPAAGAGAAGRTSARHARFTGWDADGGYAEYAVVAEALRLPPARGLVRRRRRAAAVRRASSATARCGGRAARRRPARHLRLRGLGAPRRAGRHRPGSDGARADALRGRPASWRSQLGAPRR